MNKEEVKYNLYDLDGKTNGFGVINPDWVDDIFSSLEMAKIYCMRNKISNPEFAIYIDELGGFVPYNDVEEVQGLEGFYEWYNESGDRFIFRTIPNIKIAQLGYLVFGNGDRVFIEDTDIGKRTRNRLYREIYKNLGLVATTSNIKVSYYKENIVVSIVGTTAKLNISTVSHMIWYNKQRKGYGIDKSHSRVLPFLKEMDRWSTFYMFTTIDSTEPADFNGIDQVIRVRDKLINCFRDIGDPETDCRYVPVEFGGTILV